MHGIACDPATSSIPPSDECSKLLHFFVFGELVSHHAAEIQAIDVLGVLLGLTSLPRVRGFSVSRLRL